jgi:hypothetical protein
MARVTITIEDLPAGKISVRAEPNLATIAKMRIDQELTPAEQTAVMALREIQRAFKEAAAEDKRTFLERALGYVKRSPRFVRPS